MATASIDKETKEKAVFAARSLIRGNAMMLSEEAVASMAAYVHYHETMWENLAAQTSRPAITVSEVKLGVLETKNSVHASDYADDIVSEHCSNCFMVLHRRPTEPPVSPCPGCGR